MSTKRIDVGLDAGGSKTQLLAQWNGSSDQIERRGPGANPQRAGLEQSAEVLATLVRETIEPYRPVADLSVCAGVAGAGRTDEQTVLAEHLRRALEGEAELVRVRVVHDAHIALEAAFGEESGLVIIAGTGSVVFARARDDTTRRVGGWGHILGDPGSGYGIGRAGLQAVAETFDGGAETSLRTRVKDQYDIDARGTLIHRVYQEEFALQNVAPLVIEAAEEGDAVASEILTAQTAGLVEQVQWLINGKDRIAPQIALLGGMLRNKYYAEVLRHTLHDQVPNWSVDVLQHEPVVGALRWAHRLVS